MSARVTNLAVSLIHEEIESHSAWYGDITGLNAEKMLRGRKTSYLYILRKGESSKGDGVNYYVTYILPDSTIAHRPFVITLTPEGFDWENTGGGGGPHTMSIEDILHMIMHCEKGQNIPLNRIAIK